MHVIIKSATVLSLFGKSFGFAPQNIFHQVSTASELEAKTDRKRRPTTSNAAGFGKKLMKEKEKNVSNDDFIAYPPLEEEVKTTLIPSSPEVSEVAQDLSVEFYDRISQIYGLNDFNFPVGWFDDEKSTTESKEALSFDELLSGSGETKSESLFGDLLGTTSPKSIPSTSDHLDIEKLPPFEKFRVLHIDPMVICVDDFFSNEECDEYVALCENPKKRTSNNDMPMMSRSKTVGKDSLAKAQRTSTTWFHHFQATPALMAKASRLVGLRNIDRWEEPQTVRYQQTEKFTWHLDALAPSNTLKDSGGQRIATLLVYLNDVGENNGGATVFRDLGKDGDYLRVQPRKGSALLFFPAAGGIAGTPFDVRTLHAGEAMSKDADTSKWIAQLWLRENTLYSPTAPPGNSHVAATDEINTYCSNY